MSRKILFLSCLFFCSITFSQSDKYNLKNDSKFDSILKIKKRVDKKIFDENYYSIQEIKSNFVESIDNSILITGIGMGNSFNFFQNEILLDCKSKINNIK